VSNLLDAIPPVDAIPYRQGRRRRDRVR